MTYISSITSKYGDIDNMRRDVAALNDIYSRQGSSLIIDALAESVATSIMKLNLSFSSSEIIREALVEELRYSLEERT